MGRKRKGDNTKRLLIDPSGQTEMFEKSYEQEIREEQEREVECLGKKFPNDAARREYFLDRLREHLQDPEFRKIEGFPIGSDDDILALSDPPYYTLCPNPFLADFVEQSGERYDPRQPYSREPFAGDVSEGKNDPIYNAHSYHTKVPHKAIMRYILQYTEPGDIVLDGFCGTGMTGVAGQLCDDPATLAALGYSVNADGTLVDAGSNPISKIGARHVVLNDLSPAATLIAAGYNLTRDTRGFARFAAGLLKRFNEQYGWMYQTTDPKTGAECEIAFTVWSELFNCPECSGELNFWELAYDPSTGTVDSAPTCPHCDAEVSKRELVRRTTTFHDPALGETRSKQVVCPVEIHYTHRGESKVKKPDKADTATLRKVEEMLPAVKYPTELMMFVDDGREWGDLYRGYHEGISRVHDFHLSRQLVAFSLLWHMGDEAPTEELKRLWRFVLQSIVVSFTRRNRFLKNAYSQVNRALSGTLYIGSTVSEPSPTYVLSGKIKRFNGAIPITRGTAIISTQSLSSIELPDHSVDYAFIDPPFGDNLPYAELNFLWEAWLRVFTHARSDAVVSGTQNKNLLAYTDMMTAGLRTIFRVLKPGRWLTVEFHNSKNAVWSAIQEAIGRAGFIIADVSVLDKGMKTKKQMHAKAVDKDLVISAYKPNGGLEERFALEAGTPEGAWDFVRTHLRQLPVFIERSGRAQVIAERQHVLLFDRMVAFHVQRGVSVPLSAGDFYQGVSERFPERDGMYFLPEQIEEYERKRITFQELGQLELFISDEASAIQWLRQQLKDKPQTFKELQPQFMRETQGGWQKHERQLELLELLEQNFLRYNGDDDVPSQVHSYLSTNHKEHRNKPKDDAELRHKGKDRWYVPDPSKVSDLDKLREKSLLREFEDHRASQAKVLKLFRIEAIRAGFKLAYDQRDYQMIVDVAAKLPEAVLLEDEKLLMYFDVARTRLGTEDEGKLF